MKVKVLERGGKILIPPREMDEHDVRPRDLFQIIDPPYYEIDPITRKPGETLQLFRASQS